MNPKQPPLRVLDQLGALRRYALSLTRNPHDAEDLVQEALTRAYAQRHQLRSSASLRGWLMSILHNVFISDWRHRQASGGEVVSLDEAIDARVNAGQEHAVRLAQIQQAFMRLPAEQRSALHLVTIEGMSYQEAAASLNVPIGTLMSRLGRARAALREFENRPPRPSPVESSPRRRFKVVGGHDVDD